MVKAKNPHRESILRWNNLFVYDYWFRKKYNIPFGSPQHRAICQIDIFYEWLEDKTFAEYYKDKDEWDKKKKRLDEGIWIEDRDVELETEDNDELFDKFKNNFAAGGFDNIKFEE